MDRRSFIKQTVAAGSLAAVPGIQLMAREKGNAKQPNILFIMTDQQTAMAMSNRNNPWLHTPNMDRLAKHGTSFTKAYCPQPFCGP